MLRSLAHNESALMSTEKQITANRENARHSTGPRTEEGKARSSMNAVKTGLTGRTVLLTTDDATAYEQHIAHLVQTYRPLGDVEQTLVQSIADTEWRLMRIPSLEAGIYALGRREFAELFASEDPAVAVSLIEAKTFLVYQKQLNNLSIQENRLRRQRNSDLQALKEHQTARQAKCESPLPPPPKLSNSDRSRSGNGFEFADRILERAYARLEEQRRKLDRNIDPFHESQRQKQPDAA